MKTLRLASAEHQGPDGTRHAALRSLDPPSLFLSLFALVSLLQVDPIPEVLPAIAGVLLIPGLVLGRRRLPASYRRAWSVASFLFLALMVGAYILRGIAPHVVLVFISLFFLLYKWFNARGIKEHLEIWCLSALLFLVGAMQGTGLLSLVVLLGWGMSTLQLLNLVGMLRGFTVHQLRSESPYHFAPHSARGLWGALPLLLLLTLALFYGLPRFRVPERHPATTTSLPTPAERVAVQTGYSDEVNLYSMSAIKTSNAAAFRVIEPPPQIIASEVRFRVSVLDHFDGWEWHRAAPGSAPAVDLSAQGLLIPGREKTDEPRMPAMVLDWYYIRLVGYANPIIPMPDTALSLAGFPRDAGITLESDGRVVARKGSLPREFQILADSYPKKSSDYRLLRGAALPEHLEIPEALADSVRDAATRMLPPSAETPADKARALTAYMRRNGVYTLDIDEIPDGPRGLEHFLDNNMAGHCELFATAAALILRAKGIPTRLVTGFLGGDTVPGLYNSDRTDILVTNRNAHAWVEIYDPSLGWTTIDPTPSQPLTTRPEIAGSRIERLIEENSRLVSGFIENYGYDSQRRAVAGLRDSLTSRIREWDHGALLTAWARIRQNAGEPFLVLLALGLVAFNAAAWCLYYRWPTFGRRRRTRRELSRMGANRQGTLLADILEALHVEHSESIARRPPRETILHSGAALGVPSPLAGRLAELYNQWRYGDGDPAHAAEIKQILRAIRRRHWEPLESRS